MREFHDRRRLKKFLHSRYAIALLVILCGFLLNAAWGVYGKYERSREIAHRAEVELRALEERQKFLSVSIADLGTELGREKEIRDKFGAVKEGERMIVLVDEEPSGGDSVQVPQRSIWRKFIGLFTRD